MTSYYALLNKLETFFNAHLQVKKFGGEFREQMPNFSTMDERYPLVYVVPQPAIPGQNTNVFNLDVYCVDIIQKDRANINTILSDCQLILNDLYLYYTEGTDLSVTVITDPSMTPLNNFDLDYVAGWVGTFTFEVNQYSVCAIPLEPITPVTNECPPASYLVEYENGTDIQEGTIPSGGNLTIQVPNPIECEDARYQIEDSEFNILYSGFIPSGGDLTQVITDSFVSNSNDTYTANVLAQGSLELPDVTFSINNTLGTQVLSSQVPSVTNQTLIALDGAVHIKHEADGTIAVVSTPSGVQTNYVVLNNDITVNQAFPFEIHATDPLNIRVHNPQGGDITPQSVVYQGNSNHVTITINPSSFVPVGATLMKTGQTTSYRTGDDGDIEAGRATSFTQLASNNPFGNTNRFTDELGGQTYTNNIVIDWSTYNGSNVLGISRINIATGQTWNQAIDNSLSYSIGSFTTGWRLPNMKEIFNLMNYNNDPSTFLNYSPLNLSSVGRLYWSSNTVILGTTSAYILNNVGMTGQVGKTISANMTYFRVRTFTVTGTTLT